MNTRQLHCPRPILKLARQVSQLPLHERKALWSAYRCIRSYVRSGSLPARAENLSAHLASQVGLPTPYRIISLALKLARAYSRQTLAQQGAPARVDRVLLEETLFLVHRRVQVLSGRRAPDELAQWHLNSHQLTRPWLAICDGSCRESASSAGLVILDASETLRAEVSLTVEACDSVEAELLACKTALETLLVLGAKQAKVLVDAQSVVVAMRGGLALRLSVHEGALRNLAARFDALVVCQVSRVTTHQADRLAAALNSPRP